LRKTKLWYPLLKCILLFFTIALILIIELDFFVVHSSDKTDEFNRLNIKVYEIQFYCFALSIQLLSRFWVLILLMIFVILNQSLLAIEISDYSIFYTSILTNLYFLFYVHRYWTIKIKRFN